MSLCPLCFKKIRGKHFHWCSPRTTAQVTTLSTTSTVSTPPITSVSTPQPASTALPIEVTTNLDNRIRKIYEEKYDRYYHRSPPSYSTFKRRYMERISKTKGKSKNRSKVKRNTTYLQTNFVSDIPTSSSATTARTTTFTVTTQSLETTQAFHRILPGTTPNSFEKRSQATEQVFKINPKWHRTSSPSKIHFRSKGKLIGSLNFAHLIIDIPLKDFVEGATSICNGTTNWVGQLKRYNSQHKQYYADLIHIYDLQCQNMMSRLHDVNYIWLEGKLTDLSHSQDVPPHKRVKRQFFFGGFLVGAGIIAIASYLFSHSSLLSISYGSNQNPLTINHLQDHETKILQNQRSITLLEATVKDLRQALEEEHEQSHLLHLLMKAQHTLASVNDDLKDFIGGMKALHGHRLSPLLVQGDQLMPVVDRMRLKLRKMGMIPAIDHIEDIFRMETSHMIFKNGTVRVFIHVPAYKQGTLMDLHEYVSTPVEIHPGTFIYPQPGSVYLASNMANSLFKTFTPTEFSLCRDIGEIYYCKNANWYQKRYQDNCLINIFLHDAERIRQHCKFTLTKTKEAMTQMNSDTFLVYSNDSTTATHYCPGSDHPAEQISFEGTKEFTIWPSCEVTTPVFKMEGSMDVFMEPDTIKFEELDIFTESDLKDIRDNFHLLPNSALELVGTTKGLSIPNIRAEFAAQKQREIFKVSLLSGVIGIVVVVIFCICCFKYFPFGRFFRWLFARQAHNVPVQNPMQAPAAPQQHEHIELQPLNPNPPVNPHLVPQVAIRAPLQPFQNINP